MPKPKKHTSRRLLRAEHFLYFVVVSFVLLFAWWLFGLNYVNHSNLTGGNNGNAPGTQNDYKSLDLSRVRQAQFTSQAIEQVSSVSSQNPKVRKYIMKFGVPIDNLTEKGLMTLPATPAPAGGYPVLIMCHGYANPWSYSTEHSYTSDEVFYASHGFAVLKPDYRGQGLSVPDGQPEGGYYSMAYNTDVLSLIAAVKATSYLNKSKINIWGHSMGAYVALRAAVTSHDIKHAILLSGPIASFADMYDAYVAISDTQNTTAANVRLDALNRYGTPLSNRLFWAKASPGNYVADTKTEFQIHVGTDDAIVPPRFSADFDATLTAAHKKHEYYVYPGGKHGLVAERSEIWPRSLKFLESK